MVLTLVHCNQVHWAPAPIPAGECRRNACRSPNSYRTTGSRQLSHSRLGTQLLSGSRRWSAVAPSVTRRLGSRTRVRASLDESEGPERKESGKSTATEVAPRPAAEEASEGDVIPATLKGSSEKTSGGGVQEAKQLTLDDVNPVGLGRRSRQLFDDVWRRLVQLGQLTQPTVEEQYALPEGPNCDFTTPMAEYTTVLVAGATGRVGRVLVRKLLLRGYSVKALLRNSDPETLEKLPRSVKWVVGDLADVKTLAGAVEGCTKIIFCARANSALSGDLLRVEQMGVDNLSRAFMDYNHNLAQRRRGRSAKSKVTIAKFSRASYQEGWSVGEGKASKEEVDSRYDGGMDAELEFTEKGTGLFKGYVFTRGGFVEMVRTISLPDGVFLDRYEGLVLNLIGDGKSYSLVLHTGGGGPSYSARFNTRLGYSRVRLPFNAFRPLVAEDPPLDVAQVQRLAVRFEPRKMKPSPSGAVGGLSRDENEFRLEVDFIKLLPGGEETDFILVSCTGAGVAEDRREKVLRAKLAGEGVLRNSGLGYTIVRPGPLAEEPGGQKALVFDQGSRITQGISCADVADVCVKSLHDPTARNKTFDVCNEYTDGQGLYELDEGSIIEQLIDNLPRYGQSHFVVAHLPDKSNNYLTPALALLEKNT